MVNNEYAFMNIFPRKNRFKNDLKELTPILNMLIFYKIGGRTHSKVCYRMYLNI